MPGVDEIAFVLGVLVVAAPAALVVVLGMPALAGYRPSEEAVGRACKLAIAVGLAAALGIAGILVQPGEQRIAVDFGSWIHLHSGHSDHYHFALRFTFDRLAVAFALLTFALCGTIAAFAVRYMHREPGYHRFFVLYSLFLAGMVIAAVSDSIETLFIGWELVGLSSAFLIGFFHERPAPVRNALWVWGVYRIADVALLLAVVLIHHASGSGDYATMERATPHAFTIGLLLLIAAAGKSALVPFSGWLPRAMEGPTPSSAVFYGALSVHLGAFLLLRFHPLIAASATLAVIIVVLGLVTALYAYLVGSVQTDIKSALSFASLAQVGVIVAEIGAGHWLPVLWTVALIHLLGHACMRTLQFVRAPTLLQDYRVLEDALGERLPRPSGVLASAPPDLRGWLYRFALERGYLDAILADYVARPVVAVFRFCDALERRWTAFLAGTPAPQPSTDRSPG